MSKKITSTGSTEVLYHYSCKERLFEILSSGCMADRLFIRRKNGPGWVRL